MQWLTMIMSVSRSEYYHIFFLSLLSTWFSHVLCCWNKSHCIVLHCYCWNTHSATELWHFNPLIVGRPLKVRTLIDIVSALEAHSHLQRHESRTELNCAEAFWPWWHGLPFLCLWKYNTWTSAWGLNWNLYHIHHKSSCIFVPIR